VPRLGVVAVHYYPEYVRPSLHALQDLLRRHPAEVFIAVANRDVVQAPLAESLPRLRAGASEIVAHDNSGLEFGAWHAGLQHLRGAGLDWIVFANDTFPVHSCFCGVHRRRLLDALARPALGGALEVAGKIESIDKSYTLQGFRTHRWLTTSIFALNAAALEAIGHRLHHAPVDALVRDTDDPRAFFSERLDPTLVAHLQAWLFGDPERGAWYGAGPLTSTNASRLAAKARSVLHEKFVSALLDEAGAWFFNIKPSNARERVARHVEELLFRLSRVDLLRRRARRAGPARGAT
jgi:hypothetical protein